MLPTRTNVTAARIRLNNLQIKVFVAGSAALGRHDGRFSECLAAAPAHLRAQYKTARDRVDALEHEAVSSGRAWRSSGGLITWNR